MLKEMSRDGAFTLTIGLEAKFLWAAAGGEKKMRAKG
jgi:hypothetical protein